MKLVKKLILICLIFGATMSVSAQTFYGGLSLNPAEDQDFGTVQVGYGAQTARSVSVNFMGNQPVGPLTVALSGADAANFELSTNTLSLDQKRMTFDSPQKVSFGSGLDPLTPAGGSVMIMASAFTTDSRGKTVVVTYTMSTPGYLNVVDIGTNSVVESYMGPDSGQSFAWGISKLESSNVVYVGVTLGGTGYIYKYDPDTQTFTQDATIPSGSSYVFNMTSYGTDIYFGTYSGGCVYKYDTVNKTFTQLWKSGFSYVCGADIYNGKIYAGIETSSYDNCLYEIDMATGAAKNIPLPDNYKTVMNSGLTADQITAPNCKVQSLMIRGDFAVISLIDNRTATAKNWLMLYNVTTETWAAAAPTAVGGGYQGCIVPEYVDSNFNKKLSIMELEKNHPCRKNNGKSCSFEFKTFVSDACFCCSDRGILSFLFQSFMPKKTHCFDRNKREYMTIINTKKGQRILGQDRILSNAGFGWLYLCAL